MIEKYFDKFPDTVFSINNVKSVKTVHFWLNNSWVIPEGIIPDRVGLTQSRESVDKDNKDRHYCLVFSKEPTTGGDVAETGNADITYDELFEVVYALFNYNIEKEKKDQLLRTTIQELKEKFDNLSLNELETMKFG